MLRSKDLSVGDWVYYGECHSNMEGDYDVIFAPKRLTLQDFKFFAENEWCDVDFDEFLKPIELTPEILLKNGFEKEEVYGSLITKRFKRGWLTIETGGTIYRVIARNFFCTVRYVHQLQHALKHLEFEQEIVL